MHGISPANARRKDNNSWPDASTPLFAFFRIHHQSIFICFLCNLVPTSVFSDMFINQQHFFEKFMWHSLIFLTKELFFQTSGRKLGWTRKKKYLSRVEFSHWYIRTKTEGGRTKNGSAHSPYLLPKNHPLKPR